MGLLFVVEDRPVPPQPKAKASSSTESNVKRRIGKKRAGMLPIADTPNDESGAAMFFDVAGLLPFCRPQ